MTLNVISIEEQIEIESILAEASAWGLRIEVVETAKKYIDKGINTIDSYHYAYEDWIK